jgi:hypothetical protein
MEHGIQLIRSRRVHGLAKHENSTLFEVGEIQRGLYTYEQHHPWKVVGTDQKDRKCLEDRELDAVVERIGCRNTRTRTPRMTTSAFPQNYTFELMYREMVTRSEIMWLTPSLRKYFESLHELLTVGGALPHWWGYQQLRNCIF